MKVCVLPKNTGQYLAGSVTQKSPDIFVGKTGPNRSARPLPFADNSQRLNTGLSSGKAEH